MHSINCFLTGEVEGRGVSRSDVRETHDGRAHATGSAAQDQSSKLEKVDSRLLLLLHSGKPASLHRQNARLYFSVVTGLAHNLGSGDKLRDI